jgi:hypothetical protein
MAFSDPRYLFLLGVVAVILPCCRETLALLASLFVGLGFYAALNRHNWLS